nr:retrovirus-related Pol polyprotein from transposon TNT 1-94 [Tanacetum cinerariifolium]
MIEKKVITKPIDYATLNQLSTDFNTRFVPQTESYAEQAFWSQYSVQTDEPTHSGTTIVEVLKELPKVSMVVQIVLWYLDSGCSKHITGDLSQLTNFVDKFLGTVKFGNDHVAKIMGYGDYQIGNVTILKVYFMEELGHNLFSVRQFCDSDLEVAFRQHTCFICNLEGVDMLTGSRGNNLYTLSLGDMKFLGTVKFGNDHVAKIMGYGDYQIRNVTISWVYYVEGLGHNLFSVGQFCDSDLEVAFRQHTCFIRNLERVDLLT